MRVDYVIGTLVRVPARLLRKKGGRNNAGRITARRIGGGHKRRYRTIDFRRTRFDIQATVERIEYDPNRTAFIALIRYSDDELAYILAPQRLNIGDKVISSSKSADIKPGNAGVRAQILGLDGKLLDDFWIESDGLIIHVLNAPSPAATASISVGERSLILQNPNLIF